ncbi:MAG: metallophosphoesterase, partial [Chloroflexota bacterium]|nr:metallophosphoesterase [Chloroflexota bacterium]
LRSPTPAGQPLASPELVGVLVGAGDIAECSANGDEQTAAILDAVVEEHPEAIVFTTGDGAYQDGSEEEYHTCYGPSWGRHKDRTRPAVGNHDFKQRQASGYHAYYGDRGGEFDLYYYSYDINGWHIVVLNSECHRVGCDFDSDDGEQVEWLAADLAASDASCTIAMWHHPRWSSGRYSNDVDYDRIWEVLYEHGVEIVLNGHEHLYERFEPMNPDGELDENRGIRQFIVGTGGGNLRDFENIQPNSAARGVDHGVLRLDLRQTSYDWEFMPVAGGTFTDAGSGRCH